LLQRPRSVDEVRPPEPRTPEEGSKRIAEELYEHRRARLAPQDEEQAPTTPVDEVVPMAADEPPSPTERPLKLSDPEQTRNENVQETLERSRAREDDDWRPA
jgi:hypothetical protein